MEPDLEELETVVLRSLVLRLSLNIGLSIKFLPVRRARRKEKLKGRLKGGSTCTVRLLSMMQRNVIGLSVCLSLQFSGLESLRRTNAVRER